MKNIKLKNKFFGLAMIFAMLMTSCSEDFLDVTLDDTVNAETFYGSEADVKLGVAGVYEMLTDVNSFQRYQIIGQSLWTDDMWKQSFIGPAFDYDGVAIGTHSSVSKPIVDMWNYFYTMIRRANDFLEGVGNAEANGSLTMDSALLQRYKNEIRFLRAYAYQELVFLYGDVPFILTSPGPEELKTIGRSPRLEVIDFVISELEDVSTALPAVYTGEDVGRITKGAASALLGRLQLFEQDYVASIAASQEVMSNGQYDLETNFGDIFLLSNESNEEVIFDAHHLQVIYTNWIAQYTLPSVLGGWGGGTIPSKNLVDAFEMQATGLPITDPTSGYDSNNPYDGRDPRLSKTVAYPGAVVDGETFDGSGTATGFYNVKYFDPEVRAIGAPGVSQNYILIRFAEVLLNFAEASNELSGPSSDVYDAINRIRNRAGMPDLPVGLSQSEMRERIRNERRVELALEGDRFYSIRRWGIAENIVPQDILGVDEQGNTIVASSQRVFDPGKDYLWPIPQSQIDLTEPGVTTQNPGW
ncbi:RagB/SusD family nutrient uptake outer membrane protein [Seonamhaeicola sp.]|uniref:RagB/SusD family nutrient uptake outer membrane protein n=1 Tax=Seonamhaeicola sp. TaxID=1912245 RepID=UPI00262E9BE4|nr:RagB/SusD family nutrient uptake outer membrane protein [Seonamhaeicola sp.]